MVNSSDVVCWLVDSLGTDEVKKLMGPYSVIVFSDPVFSSSLSFEA